MKKNVDKLVLLVALTLVCSHKLASQSPSPAQIQPGRVIEQIPVSSQPGQSYAAYLPSNYDPTKTRPTVFCLDPRARGKLALERFVAAAEKYGYIVICSNTSRNGLGSEQVSDILTNFWNDAHARFNIDPKRTFAAGFSGGSRLSSMLASRCRGCLAGVIGLGAGFPADIQPDAKTTFAYFGAAGVDDFNFQEMWYLEKKFDELSAPYHFENFAGGHEWATVEVIDHALAWLTLQSIKAGNANRDEKFLGEQLQNRTREAESFLTSQRFVDAYSAFRSIVRDFDGLLDVATAKVRVEELRKNDQLKKDQKSEEEYLKRQLIEAGTIRSLWTKKIEPDQIQFPRLEAAQKLGELRRRKDATHDSRDRRLARRILSGLLVESFESAQPALQAKNYDVALDNYLLAKEVDPKSASVAFELGRVYAFRKQKKQALESLEESVKLGFKDVERLRTEPAFASFVDDARYQKLLTTLAGP